MMRQEGSSFSFRRGDTRMQIRCGDEQPIQVCIEGAVILIDKFNATPR